MSGRHLQRHPGEAKVAVRQNPLPLQPARPLRHAKRSRQPAGRRQTSQRRSLQRPPVMALQVADPPKRSRCALKAGARRFSARIPPGNALRGNPRRGNGRRLTRRSFPAGLHHQPSICHCPTAAHAALHHPHWSTGVRSETRQIEVRPTGAGSASHSALSALARARATQRTPSRSEHEDGNEVHDPTHSEPTCNPNDTSARIEICSSSRQLPACFLGSVRRPAVHAPNCEVTALVRSVTPGG